MKKILTCLLAVVLLAGCFNKTEGKPKLVVKCLEKLGADFKKEFTFDSYKQFFAKAGFEEVQYKLIKGKLPCAIAVIRKG